MDFVPVARRLVSDVLQQRPEWATELGDHSHDDALSDLSDDGDRALASIAQQALTDLEAVDVEGLTTSDRVDREIAQVGLRRVLLDLELGHKRWDPLPWLPGDALYPLLVRETLPAADRLRALAGRLAQVPDRLAAAQATLSDMPRVHVETALGQTDGNLLLVRDELSRLLAEEPGLRGVVEPAQAAADQALVGFRTFLAEQAESASGDPRLGADLFARRLPLVLDSGLSADEIWQMASDRLDEVHDELRSVVGGDDDAVLPRWRRVASRRRTTRRSSPLARQAYAEATETVRRLGLATVPDEVADSW